HWSGTRTKRGCGWGLTPHQSPRLRVRNRIYARVFDAGWVAMRMPGAELRRQRAAYRRGVLRTAGAAAMLLAAVAGMALFAIRQNRRTEQSSYAADMNLAQQAWEDGNLAGAQRLLEAHARPRWFWEEDLRGFEWRYLRRLCEDKSLALLEKH